ncbi:TRAP transporter small permease [Denitromonas sp.]|uniref:TRAP transporter small permease n=1 Tax=Denitromonas sp. TaxID=2734609 RepID=UPI003A85EB00
MNRLSQLLARLSVTLGGTTLVLMTAMVVVDIFMRTLLSRSLGFVDEITGYLVAMVTFLGASITFREGEMFRVSFLFEKFPAALKKFLGTVYLVFAAIFCATMLWYTSLLVWSSFVRDKVAPTELQTPIYLPQLALPLGFLIFLVFAVDKLIKGAGVEAPDGSSGSHAESLGE